MCPVSFSSKLCLYNSFVMPYFTYCSAIWHNCHDSDHQKLESINARALKYVLGKRVLTDGNDQFGKTLYNRRLQDLVSREARFINQSDRRSERTRA